MNRPNRFFFGIPLKARKFRIKTPEDFLLSALFRESLDFHAETGVLINFLHKKNDLLVYKKHCKSLIDSLFAHT